MTTIFAVDAATIKSGYAFLRMEDNKITIEDFGWVKAKGTMGERLNQLRSTIRDRVQEYQPDFVAVEDLKFNRGTPNLSSMTKVAFAIGNVYTAFEEAGHKEIISLTANVVRKVWDVKQAKEPLRRAVNKKFLEQLVDKGRPDGFTKSDQDIVDAVGLAVAAWVKEINNE